MPPKSIDDRRYLISGALTRIAREASGKAYGRLCEYLWQRHGDHFSLAETTCDLNDTGPGKEEVGPPRFTLRH